MFTNNRTTVKLIDFGYGFIKQDGNAPLSYFGTPECLLSTSMYTCILSSLLKHTGNQQKGR